MLLDRIEARWIEAFKTVFERCGVSAGEDVVILSESQSRPVNVQLTEIALDMLGAKICHVVLPTQRQMCIRDSTLPGCSLVIFCCLTCSNDTRT